MTDEERRATIEKLQPAFRELHKDAYEKNPVDLPARLDLENWSKESSIWMLRIR